MRTECKQARFEFHGLFQRKVKARFDGGKITSDAGVLLLREVERGTGLIAGLAECFRVKVFDDFEATAEEAVRRFGRGPYLIRQVAAPPVTLPASVMYPLQHADH